MPARGSQSIIVGNVPLPVTQPQFLFKSCGATTVETDQIPAPGVGKALVIHTISGSLWTFTGHTCEGFAFRGGAALLIQLVLTSGTIIPGSPYCWIFDAQLDENVALRSLAYTQNYPAPIAVTYRVVTL